MKVEHGLEGNDIDWLFSSGAPAGLQRDSRCGAERKHWEMFYTYIFGFRTVGATLVMDGNWSRAVHLEIKKTSQLVEQV